MPRCVIGPFLVVVLGVAGCSGASPAGSPPSQSKDTNGSSSGPSGSYFLSSGTPPSSGHYAGDVTALSVGTDGSCQGTITTTDSSGNATDHAATCTVDASDQSIQFSVPDLAPLTPTFSYVSNPDATLLRLTFNLVGYLYQNVLVEQGYQDPGTSDGS
jgi:hypothetical protein